MQSNKLNSATSNKFMVKKQENMLLKGLQAFKMKEDYESSGEDETSDSEYKNIRKPGRNKAEEEKRSFKKIKLKKKGADGELLIGVKKLDPSETQTFAGT